MIGAQGAWADDNRMNKRFGLYAGLLGDPLLSFGGINAAYNADDFLRLTGGLGKPYTILQGMRASSSKE